MMFAIFAMMMMVVMTIVTTLNNYLHDGGGDDGVAHRSPDKLAEDIRRVGDILAVDIQAGEDESICGVYGDNILLQRQHKPQNENKTASFPFRINDLSRYYNALHALFHLILDPF
ncbi:hypothetical protein Leryth_023863, partial [Lithospermum erythrorhizon]